MPCRDQASRFRENDIQKMHLIICLINARSHDFIKPLHKGYSCGVCARSHERFVFPPSIMDRDLVSEWDG